MKSRIFRVVFLLMLVFNSSCREENVEKSGIVFTFDDQYVLEWYNARDLFKEYGIKATFFINRPQNLTSEQILMLKQLKDDGHEIACHSMNHVNLNDFLLTHNLKDYINQEIIPAIEKMKEYGFDVKSYAYPYGISTPNANEELLKYFKIIRKATYNYENLELDQINRVFTKVDSCRIVDAMGIDSGYGIKIGNFEKGVIRAKSKNEVLVLYAHKIVKNPTGAQVSQEFLKEVFMICRKHNLKSLTISKLVK